MGKKATVYKTDSKSMSQVPENKSEKKDVEIQLPSKAPGDPSDNEFEKRIKPEIIPANEIEVTFEDVGGLNEIKESLHESRSCSLFEDGLKPCRGILLFEQSGVYKHEIIWKIKNQFLAHWDRLLTKTDVLAATNRPFDLQAIIGGLNKGSRELKKAKAQRKLQNQKKIIKRKELYYS